MSEKSEKQLLHEIYNMSKILKKPSGYRKHSSMSKYSYNNKIKGNNWHPQKRAHGSSLKWQKKDENCVFFKEGKCKKGSMCQYVHDSGAVSICKYYLKGNCLNDRCILSHDINQSKLPFCQFFIFGNCTKDDCPYPHVKVNPNSAICSDFINGHCAQGLECKLLHTYKDNKEKKL